MARPSVEGHKKVRDRGNGLDPAWKVVAVALDHLRQKVEVPKLVEVDQKPETTIRKVRGISYVQKENAPFLALFLKRPFTWAVNLVRTVSHKKTPVFYSTLVQQHFFGTQWL